MKQKHGKICYNVFKAGGGYAAVAAGSRGIEFFCLPQKSRRSACAKVEKYFKGAVKQEKGIDELEALCCVLSGYFETGTGDFSGVKTYLPGFTGFEKRVLAAVKKIPAGEVRTYGWIASAAGAAGAARAAGNALNKNPVPVLIPCHRVVKSSGDTGGFSEGIKWKKRLIEIEKIKGPEAAGERKKNGCKKKKNTV